MIEHPSTLLPGFAPTDLELVRSLPMDKLVERAIELLRRHEPPEGYYLAFSGGKDSCVIKELAKMAGVKFEAWYSQTTIDPPELVRFIKEHHADVKWRLPEHGNMFAYIVRRGIMPTRFIRWCCEEYKETGGDGRICIFGVRAEESHARAMRWREVSEAKGKSKSAICPIVYWSSEQVWAFHKQFKLAHCPLYDEGWTRIGCVGCPLAAKTIQRAEFRRWPSFERNWKKACFAVWQNFKDVPLPNGKPRYQNRFKTAQEFWEWWTAEETPDVMREECQTGLLWTNQEVEDL